MTKVPNPKDLLGVKKVPSHSVVPATGLIYEALGMWDGAGKYGPFNWREHPVLATVYLDACDRHLKAWAAGEHVDPKSGMPHLGHAKACLGILIDAYETGNLIDDRPKNEAVVRLFEQYDRTPKEIPTDAHAAIPDDRTDPTAGREPGAPDRAPTGRR